MPDREKVIKGIQECDLNGGLIGNCPYKGILDLLKKQEAVEPLFNERMKWFVCPNCSLVLDEMRDDYCPSCGKRIAWNDYYLHEDETESR